MENTLYCLIRRNGHAQIHRACLGSSGGGLVRAPGMTSLDTSSDIPTHGDCCQQRFPQATAYGRYRVTKLPFACGSKLSHPWCRHNTFHLRTQALQILILLTFLIAWDKVAAGTVTRLRLPPPCICGCEWARSSPERELPEDFGPV